MDNNASRMIRQDPAKLKASGPIIFNFRTPGPYNMETRSPDKQASNTSSPTTKASGLTAQSTQALLEGKKAVYKSSKGFRVILNSVDEKKTANIKKVQSPNTSFVALTSNPVSLTHLTQVVPRQDENYAGPSSQQQSCALKRFTSL